MINGKSSPHGNSVTVSHIIIKEELTQEAKPIPTTVREGPQFSEPNRTVIQCTAKQQSDQKWYQDTAASSSQSEDP
jgi:hypothetical protein